MPLTSEEIKVLFKAGVMMERFAPSNWTMDVLEEFEDAVMLGMTGANGRTNRTIKRDEWNEQTLAAIGRWLDGERMSTPGVQVEIDMPDSPALTKLREFLATDAECLFYNARLDEREGGVVLLCGSYNKDYAGYTFDLPLSRITEEDDLADAYTWLHDVIADNNSKVNVPTPIRPEVDPSEARSNDEPASPNTEV